MCIRDRVYTEVYKLNFYLFVIGVQEDASITEELGPIPEAGSYIFLGNNFLITYTEKKKTHKVQRADREKYKSDSTDYTSGTCMLNMHYVVTCIFKLLHSAIVKCHISRTRITRLGSGIHLYC